MRMWKSNPDIEAGQMAPGYTMAGLVLTDSDCHYATIHLQRLMLHQAHRGELLVTDPCRGIEHQEQANSAVARPQTGPLCHLENLASVVHLDFCLAAGALLSAGQRAPSMLSAGCSIL